MIKQTKGITLIALIITIIVLLILAGVTINMVLGENGLFNKSKTSVAKYENAQEKENGALVKYELDIDKYINNDRETSNDIDDFMPIIEFNNGTFLDISSNATEKSSVGISGYAYIINGKVKDVTTNQTCRVNNLNMNTEYTVNVLAIDENGKTKLSNSLKVTTSSKYYIFKDGIEYNDSNIKAFETYNQTSATVSASISNNKLTINNSSNNEYNCYRGIRKEISFNNIQASKMYIKTGLCNISSANIGIGDPAENENGKYFTFYSDKSQEVENIANKTYEISISDINKVANFGINFILKNSQSLEVLEIWFE